MLIPCFPFVSFNLDKETMEKKKWKEEMKKQKEKEASQRIEGEVSDKQDILSCIPEGDVEGHNRVCDENESRKGAHPVQNLHQPCHQPCWSCRYISAGHHS